MKSRKFKTVCIKLESSDKSGDESLSKKNNNSVGGKYLKNWTFQSSILTQNCSNCITFALELLIHEILTF